MIHIPFYQVDAFCHQVFGGNPAAVCLLKQWPTDQVLQQIAMENNLSETAFVLLDEPHLDQHLNTPPGQLHCPLRWFTPKLEIDLCGHATLAAAFVLFTELKLPLGATFDAIHFATHSGELIVSQSDYGLTMDFPARPAQAVTMTGAWLNALSQAPLEVYKAERDYLLVYPDEASIRHLSVDFPALKAVDSLGVIVTAQGDEVDFVSRFFAPNAGVDEDPVTGSAHCTLTPFWAQRLAKNTLNARQLSQRQGEVHCQWVQANPIPRVLLSGQAALYLKGNIYLPGGLPGDDSPRHP